MTQTTAAQCKICMAEQPNVISMEKHYDSKHAKIKWDDALKEEYQKLKVRLVEAQQLNENCNCTNLVED